MAEIRGRYGIIAGTPALIFVRELDHPIEEVWRAVTEPDRVVAWLPCPVDGDLTTVGSPLLFVFPDPKQDLRFYYQLIPSIPFLVWHLGLYLRWCNQVHCSFRFLECLNR